MRWNHVNQAKTWLDIINPINAADLSIYVAPCDCVQPIQAVLPHGKALGDLWDSWHICNPATVMTLAITAEKYMLKEKARAIIKMPYLLSIDSIDRLLNNNKSQMWMQNRYVN